MATYTPSPADYVMARPDGKRRKLLKADVFEEFNTSLLGLGNLTARSTATDAIAAMFDLEGFTNFGKQIEPQLSVPVFMNAFLNWLIEAIKTETLHKAFPEGISLYSPLPFFVKFMGDGLLVLWDSKEMSDLQRQNIVFSLHQICKSYSSSFVPTLRKQLVDPPPRLRCGIARGTVYSVGEAKDFVGSCINMAVRLQKLPGVTFAFNRRGFDLESEGIINFFKSKIVIRSVAIRGIGDNELVALLKTDVESLDEDDRAIYRAV